MTLSERAVMKGPAGFRLRQSAEREGKKRRPKSFAKRERTDSFQMSAENIDGGRGGRFGLKREKRVGTGRERRSANLCGGREGRWGGLRES